MSSKPTVLMVTAEEADSFFCGHTVRLNGVVIGHRPYDGSCISEVEEEVVESLAELLRDRLGWDEEPSDDDE